MVTFLFEIGMNFIGVQQYFHDLKCDSRPSKHHLRHPLEKSSRPDTAAVPVESRYSDTYRCRLYDFLYIDETVQLTRWGLQTAEAPLLFNKLLSRKQHQFYIDKRSIWGKPRKIHCSFLSIKGIHIHLGEQRASPAPAVKSPCRAMNTLQILTA